jgi:hypothetical protein
MMKNYILVGQEIKEATLTEAAVFFEDVNNRIIDRTDINDDVSVSTVFLCFDHGFGREDNRPVLFETMIFGGAYDQNCWRYCTYEDAFEGHWKIVQCLREGTIPDV